MKVALKSFGSLAFAVLLVTAAHAQTKIDDCEKIQAADAYNQCLAKFGPPAKTGNLEPQRPGDVKSGSAEAAASGGKSALKGRVAGRRHGRRGSVAHRGRASGHVARAHGGRKRMTISVHR